MNTNTDTDTLADEMVTDLMTDALDTLLRRLDGLDAHLQYSTAVPADYRLPEREDDGTCEHGTYVGGIGADLMCQPCETGAEDFEYATGVLARNVRSARDVLAIVTENVQGMRDASDWRTAPATADIVRDAARSVAAVESVVASRCAGQQQVRRALGLPTLCLGHLPA